MAKVAPVDGGSRVVVVEMTEARDDRECLLFVESRCRRCSVVRVSEDQYRAGRSERESE